MKIPAARLDQFGTYAFAALDAAKKEAARRIRVIDMGVGDPDFPPPATISDALSRAAYFPEFHRYPDYEGDGFFRDAVADFMFDTHKIRLNPETQVALSVGSKEGIFHFPLAVVNHGEKVAYTSPGYPIYRAGAIFADAQPVALPLLEADQFVLDLDRVPKDIKLLWVNYPNNPTSAIVGRAFYEQLVQLAIQHEFIVAVDAAYAQTCFGAEHPSILSVDGAEKCCVEFHSISKMFCATGFRVGFVVGCAEAVGAFVKVKRFVDSGQYRGLQHAAAVGLTSYKTLTHIIRQRFAARVQKWMSALQSANITAFNYGATFYVWAKVPQGFSSAQFAEKLINQCGIVCLPGSAMGEHGEGFVRFSLTLPDEDIDFAIEALGSLD